VQRIERRAATAADEPFLRRLYASTRPEVADWPDEMREAFLAQQFEAQRTGWTATFPGSEHDVLEVGDVAVGRIWVYWTPTDCLIVDLALLPEHRRQGFGAEIVGEVIAAAARAGVPVHGHVERMNPDGLAFWTKLGFRESGSDELFIEIEHAHEARGSAS
jgi:GNAT superfamily N-acetyltransferase